MVLLSILFLIWETETMAQTPISHCPASPNCVSSLLDEDESHKVLPFDFKQTLEESQSSLQKAIIDFERASIVSKSSTYWKCEFRTQFFRLVDDVDFFFDVDSKKIHVRSASRLGYSDLGTNRKRIDQLRELYSR
ncbi:MAG: DUF1499 domain-containing protein [Deltaproteobacteria bacterium]|jgi:uncharacterized protein (DUF1499 family)